MDNILFEQNYLFDQKKVGRRSELLIKPITIIDKITLISHFLFGHFELLTLSFYSFSKFKKSLNSKL